MGVWWPGGRALHSELRDPGFDPHSAHHVVSKTSTGRLLPELSFMSAWTLYMAILVIDCPGIIVYSEISKGRKDITKTCPCNIQ